MAEFSEIIERMYERMPWTIARRVLEENKVARSMGWERTKQSLLEDPGPYLDKGEALFNDLQEHTLCGEKLLRIYEVKDDQLRSLRDAVLELSLPESDAKSRYPLSLTSTQIAGTPIGHTPIAIHRYDTGTALVFSTVRVVITREPVDTSEFPEATAGLLSQYDELVGLKNRRLQGMDVLWIPNDGQYVEVRVDFPKILPASLAEHAQTSIRFAIGKLLKVDYLHSSVNLFPLIDRMYRTDNEGLVVEFAFGTTTASTKHERMRRTSLSLRDEDYHKGGIAALDGSPISPFKLSIEWERELGENVVSKPELNLHSTSRQTLGQQGFLVDAVVRNCVGMDDFEFVRDRIYHHLSRE